MPSPAPMGTSATAPASKLHRIVHCVPRATGATAGRRSRVTWACMLGARPLAGQPSKLAVGAPFAPLRSRRPLPLWKAASAKRVSSPPHPPPEDLPASLVRTAPRVGASARRLRRCQCSQGTGGPGTSRPKRGFATMALARTAWRPVHGTIVRRRGRALPSAACPERIAGSAVSPTTTFAWAGAALARTFG